MFVFDMAEANFRDQKEIFPFETAKPNCLHRRNARYAKIEHKKNYFQIDNRYEYKILAINWYSFQLYKVIEAIRL